MFNQALNSSHFLCLNVFRKNILSKESEFIEDIFNTCSKKWRIANIYGLILNLTMRFILFPFSLPMLYFYELCRCFELFSFEKKKSR